jgi:hypothetical protein
LRSFTSFLLAGALIVMLFSGWVLYVAPGTGKGRRIGWDFWGMERPAWAAQHIVSSWVFVAACAGHILLNLRALRAYLIRRVGGRFRPQRLAELVLALALLAFMVLGTLWKIPPWSNLLSGSQHYTGAVSGEGHDEHEGPRPGRGPGPGYHGGRTD